MIKNANHYNSLNPLYCYAVYLRHLVMAHKNGLCTNPGVVIELGPGYSLGVGLTALLTGSKRYYALDFKRLVQNQFNPNILREIVKFLKKKEPIPDSKKFKNIKPNLETYVFPKEILSDDRMENSLTKTRVDLIEKELLLLDQNHPFLGKHIGYIAPWDQPETFRDIRDSSVDFILSQAVLEHVDDLQRVYKVLYRLLKPGGIMSHQIDLKSHRTDGEWNQHWTYSDEEWRHKQTPRLYPINRLPHSVHIALLRETGFRILYDQKFIRPNILDKSQLAPRFKKLPSEDLTISGAFIQAMKPR